jgi:hypothetical protein
MSFVKRRKFRQFRINKALLLYFISLAIIILTLSGCTGKGDLRFNDTNAIEKFKISGKIALPEIVETDLLGSLRTSLTSITDFRTFVVSADEVSVNADSDGNFSLPDVITSEKLVLQASSGRIKLLRRVSIDDLYYTDLSETDISIQSTAEALVWEFGLEYDKDLTAADIRAREYEPYLASLTSAIKLSLQLEPSSVPATILELKAVTDAARNAAQIILEREIILKEANKVFKHALLRQDIDLLKVYVSPAFTNDWDSSSSWQDFINYHEDFFSEKCYSDIEWSIKDYEFLPNNKARIRTEIKADIFHNASEQIVKTGTWTFDAIWRKEGSFWKIYRNLPYRETHPTQVGADSRWGEIADAHRELQTALASEDISVFESRISTVFGNDWDPTSTHSDIISTAQSRFNAMDIKIATYSIDEISFQGQDHATVKCRAQVKVINLIPGKDIDSGTIEAQVTWRRENGEWLIFRNLPYKFSHPLKINRES